MKEGDIAMHQSSDKRTNGLQGTLENSEEAGS